MWLFWQNEDTKSHLCSVFFPTKKIDGIIIWLKSSFELALIFIETGKQTNIELRQTKTKKASWPHSQCQDLTGLKTESIDLLKSVNDTWYIVIENNVVKMKAMSCNFASSFGPSCPGVNCFDSWTNRALESLLKRALASMILHTSLFF